jgi:hypothetical protein
MTEDLNVLYVAIRTLDNGTSMFIRDKPVLSSEKLLYEDYERKGSLENGNLC